MPVNIKAKLLEKEELKPGIFKFSVQADEIVNTARPGNFIEIRLHRVMKCVHLPYNPNIPQILLTSK